MRLMAQRWLVVVLLAVLVSSCITAPTRKQAAHIVVLWTLLKQVEEFTALSNGDAGGESDDGSSGVIQVRGARIARQNTTLQREMVRLKAEVKGGSPTSSPFQFAVYEDNGKTLPFTQETADTISFPVPEYPTKGSVRVVQADLMTTVPFVVLPVAMLAAEDHPSQRLRYPTDAPVGPGVFFKPGTLLEWGDATADIIQADLYALKSGELMAPYGFARVDIPPAEERLYGPWAPFHMTFDARDLTFNIGPLGISDGERALYEHAFSNMWIIKTSDGGYARVKIHANQWGRDWFITYDYSPTGLFEAY